MRIGSKSIKIIVLLVILTLLKSGRRIFSEPNVVGAQRHALAPTPETPAMVLPGLPEFAEKADDLEAIEKAVDDAASLIGGLWLSYIFVLFYLGVAAAAVTHVDLFFANPVRLPFLGIELPLVAFFLVAPTLFLIVHAYMLVHLVLLTDKAKRFDEALDTQIKDEDGQEGDKHQATRDKLRRLLPSNIFVQFLAGPTNLRKSEFGWLLCAIAWITLVVAPALLLLMFQIQFLPYHSSIVVRTQRVALVFDLALVWWLWPKVISRGKMGVTSPAVLGLLFSFVAIAFSCLIATFPGEWQEELLAKWDRSGWAVSAHNALFSAEPDSSTHRRFPFSNTLVLPGENVYEGLSISEPEKAKWRDFVFRARGRDLRGAIFALASLPKVDFYGANLREAQFLGAQLQGASLEGAQLQGASLIGARLEGTSLEWAQLQGASLDNAQLQGASLANAGLQGASLLSAQLQGASLVNAQLQGASLDGANLEGTFLNGAQLQGTSFSGATLKATELRGAYLWRSTPGGNPVTLSTIDVWEDERTWRPRWRDSRGQDRAWEEKDKDGKTAYEVIRASLQSMPSGDLRDKAFARIEVLDCLNHKQALQSCQFDAAAILPEEARNWKDAVMAQAASVQVYRTALAQAMEALFCSGDENEAFVVHNVAGKFGQLQKAGSTARDLLDKLLDKEGVGARDYMAIIFRRKSSNCPVAASLTDADRATLLKIEQQATSEAVPGR